jgi:Fe-S-cluster containining protein
MLTKDQLLQAARTAYAQGPVLERLVRESIVSPLTAQFGRSSTCASCTTGVCCNQLALCSIFDGLAMVHLAYNLGMDNAVFVEKLLDQGNRQFDSNQHDWYELKEPCVLQDPARKLCAVYMARPAPCRCAYTWAPLDCCETVEKFKEKASTPIMYQGLDKLASVVYASSCNFQKSAGLRSDTVMVSTVGIVLGTLLRALSASSDSKCYSLVNNMRCMSQEDVGRVFLDVPEKA